MHIKLATTCNKNEQQQGAENYVELWTNGRRQVGGPLMGLLNEAETGLSRPFWGWLIIMNMMMTTIMIQSFKTATS